METSHVTKDTNINDNATEKLSTFMKEVESLMTYKVATCISQYWFPILVPIGLVGNTLSFLVMAKSSNRKMSTCIYMAALSVNDNLMMCLALHDWLVVVVQIHDFHPWECEIAVYLISFCLQSSTFQVLAMTIDKYVAVKWPLTAATYSTPARARCIVILIFSFAVFYNIPHLFASSLIGDQCVAYVKGGSLLKAYSWISFVVNGLIPFTLLIYMNVIIVNRVKNSRKQFAGSLDTSNGMRLRESTIKSAEN